MQEWPTTRVTLLDRLRDPQDQGAWKEFVDLYGPLIFAFARRRLRHDEDAADVLQDVLTVVLRGSYRRPLGSFQKWLVTVLLNRIRNFAAAQTRRGTVTAALLDEQPSPGDEEEWERERQWHLFQTAAARVRLRTRPLHWDAFERAVLRGESCSEVALALGLSLTNVYSIKSRLLKEIKEEVRGLGEDCP